MTSPKAEARLAGVWYLLTGLSGVFSYLYVPGKIIVPGDAAETARRITDAALMYRFGILSDVVGQIFLVLLVLSLYSLLKDSGKKYARVMVALVAVGVAVEIANAFNLIAPLILLSGAGFLSVFTKAQLDSLALAFLAVRSSGLFIAQLFWGLWLFPFGVLVIKSGFFPTILGYLLIIACFAYVITTVLFIVGPTHMHPATHLLQPLEGLGEGAIIVWLLVKGVRERAHAPIPTNAS